MRGTGQIAELAALAPPDVACVTAIGPVHLELLGTVEAVAAAKAEVLQALRPGGHAVVPADEPLLEPHIAALDPGITVHRFGDAPDLALDLGLTKGWELRNAAAALACCRALGMVPARGRRDRGGALGAARSGAAAGGGRRADRGLLQRQPGLDAGGARRPGRAARPPGGGARRHDGAGPRGGALPPRGGRGRGGRRNRPAGGGGRARAGIRAGRRRARRRSTSPRWRRRSRRCRGWCARATSCS